MKGAAAAQRRARLRLAGSTALSDAEVIAALVGNSETASELMAVYGDLPSLSRANIGDLEHHVGVAKASAIVAALEIGRRALAPRQERPVIRGSADVFSFYGPRLSHLDREVFHALCLDTKHRVLRDARVVEGGLTTCSVLPREVYAPALREAASAVIFVHNHPSGDPSPSADDLALTARLKQAGAVLGIKPLDHIIIGEGRYLSLVDEGHFAAL
jgi:DNA repair protein RadC